MNIRDLVFSADLKALHTLLSAHPELANREISLPDNPATAHPLHRICDGVYCGYYSEETGLEVAKLFLNHGAHLNDIHLEGIDSPLTAACSLRCDQLALFYIQQEALIDHRGCHGGTALHWASWCGRDVVVDKLVTLNPDINQLCIDFKSTALFWAIHGYKFGEEDNCHHQVNCARILLDHGADLSIPNFEGYLPVQLIEDGDKEFLELFHKR
ncbi:MAG: ankyrin repeat domain-containing protein [Bacteroidota bacterium]